MNKIHFEQEDFKESIIALPKKEMILIQYFTSINVNVKFICK